MDMARRLETYSGYGPGRTRARAGAMALTLLVYTLLVAIALIFSGGAQQILRSEARLTTIRATPPKPKPPLKPELSPAPRPAKFAGVQSERLPAPAPPLLPDMPAPAIITPVISLPTVTLAEAGPASSTGRSAQEGSGDGLASGGQGAGGGGMGWTPGSRGMPLANAQWFREPTADEPRRYLLSSSAGRGWGLIACRTIEKHRVTDCETLGEFPQGSGYAKAARDAAYQYRVKAPQVDGKPQLGAWVSIRINY